MLNQYEECPELGHFLHEFVHCLYTPKLVDLDWKYH
jgi:hypothetical protein